MLTVQELWRFPVKSIGGERVDEAEVTEVGLLGDRVAGLFDVDTNTTLTARRTPELLFASARYLGPGDVAITLPDGTETADDTVLSDWLGRSVRLQFAAAEGGTYEVPLDFENDDNWVSWQGPGGSFHDSTKSRISLVSTASLGDWDRRRFRTNVILDGEGEDELVGTTARLGDEVRLDVTKRIDRCVMVTRPQPGVDRDLDVLRTINRVRATCLAIGALIDQPGRVGVGDVLVGD